MSTDKTFEEVAWEFGNEFGPFNMDFFPTNDPTEVSWSVCLIKGTRLDFETEDTGWAGYTPVETLLFAAEELRKKA